MTSPVSYLDLLDRVCRGKGWALLLTAQHIPAAFSTKALTELRHLDVIEPSSEIARRRRQLVEGDLIGRVSIDPVELDIDACAAVLLEALYESHLIERETA